MKNQPGTIKNIENHPGPMKNQSGTVKNHKNQPGAFKILKTKLEA